MRILAWFLLCSMMGGASEVLFAAAKNSLKAKFSRTTSRLANSSATVATPGACATNGATEVDPQAGKIDSG